VMEDSICQQAEWRWHCLQRWQCVLRRQHLTTTVSKENKTIVMLTGEIVKGDAEKRATHLQTVAQSSRPNPTRLS